MREIRNWTVRRSGAGMTIKGKLSGGLGSNPKDDTPIRVTYVGEIKPDPKMGGWIVATTYDGIEYRLI